MNTHIDTALYPEVAEALPNENNPKIFRYAEPFTLECGTELRTLEIAYHTYGRMNHDGSNVIWVCHALTANSDVFDWWKGLFGNSDLFNPHDHFIVCANNLGSCYGSTGPLSTNPTMKSPWFSYFPSITIRDIAHSFEQLRQHLGIRRIHTLVGGSQGGQIALEWALTNKHVTKHLVLIATNARHSAWGIAFNESQRMAVKADRTYYSNTHDAAQKGLAAARSIALLSYRGYHAYQSTQLDEKPSLIYDHRASSYQRYQGLKLIKRFNAYSYVRLLEAMDSHHVARDRAGTLQEALQTVQARTLVVSIKDDILFPVEEQVFLAEHIPEAAFAVVESEYGHDGFLIETKQLSNIISEFLGSYQL